MKQVGIIAKLNMVVIGYHAVHDYVMLKSMVLCKNHLVLACKPDHAC